MKMSSSNCRDREGGTFGVDVVTGEKVWMIGEPIAARVAAPTVPPLKNVYDQEKTSTTTARTRPSNRGRNSHMR